MTYPAWFALHEDDAVAASPTALRVYAHLVRMPNVFFEPQDVKVWLIAERLHTHRDRVTAAIALLVERGYVREHDRGLNNVRRVTLLMQQSLPGQKEAGCPSNEAASQTA